MRPSPESLLPSYADPITRLRIRKMVAIALVSLACCTAVGVTGCNVPPGWNFKIGPSKGEIIGAAIGVGAVVTTVAVLAQHHSRHTIKGCILSGPNGLELQNGSNSTFELTGLTENVKAGNRYRLHGSKLKKAKHAPGNRTFEVEKVDKDFGPCSVKLHSLALSAGYR